VIVSVIPVSVVYTVGDRSTSGGHENGIQNLEKGQFGLSIPEMTRPRAQNT
jgi:hypothetical protein